MKYRGQTITPVNHQGTICYRVGADLAANLKTAKRWIDTGHAQSMLCRDYSNHLQRAIDAGRKAVQS